MPQLQSLAEDLQLAGVEWQMDGKLCSSGDGGRDGRDLPVHTSMCGSAHDFGYVVNGSNAMVALLSLPQVTPSLHLNMYHSP